MTKKTLKQLRNERGLTQQQFADELGFARPTVARWELGTQQLKLSNKKLIALYFGVKEDDIIW